MIETQTGTLVSVRTVTAQNIIAALGMKQTEAGVKAVEQHIDDEMAAVQSHFALAVADIQNAYHEALTAFSYVKSNPKTVGAVVLAVFVLGAVVGHFV